MVPVVNGVDLDVSPGEVVGIAGESGSGKTMTALALLGLLPRVAVTEGSAFFDGHDLLAMGRRELQQVRGNEVAMVFQDPMTSLHPMLSVEQQLTEHMRRHLGLGRSEARARATDLLAEVRIPDPEAALRGYPHQFSGGMRQRIAIAAALACDPRLLIADEPTTALDVTVQAGILRLLDRLCRDHGMAVIIVTHDLGVMSSLAGRLMIFYAGNVVERGPTAELLQSPRHPYTERLLLALPNPERSDQPLQAIPGTPAIPSARPPGCAFHPRCDYAVSTCTYRVPRLEPIAPGRESACPVDPLKGRA